MSKHTPSVLVTGAAGYVGRLLLRGLADRREQFGTLIAVDLQPTPASERLDGINYVAQDIRDPGLAGLLKEHSIDTVVHLATLVDARGSSRELAYQVDVLGSQNVLRACLLADVGQLVVTSSGAAYGYHADNPVPLSEECPLRGNQSFPYAYHKRLVEEMLEEYRHSAPRLKQLVLRPGTILGAGLSNQITNLFEQSLVPGVAGSSSPFVFIWDQDVVACIIAGILQAKSGIYNLAGDGSLSLREIARRMGHRYLPLPESALRGGLGLMQRWGLTGYGPEQILFIKHRPVLDNTALKRDFGFTPRKTSDEAFETWRASRTAGHTEGLGTRLWKRLQLGTRRDFRAKVVVVTGGGRGIGLALAERFAQEGARLALLDKDQPLVEAEAARLRGLGVQALGLACDIRDEAACGQAMQRVVEELGGIDVLVNNAGCTHLSRFEETDAHVYRKVMDVNFFGALHCTHAALPALLESHGQIVVLSSVAGFSPLLERSGYCASKYALHGLFETLRAELAPQGVGVLMVCPGFTDTGMATRALGADGGPAQRPQTRVGGQATPESVAGAIFEATERGKRELVLSTTGRLARLVTRVSPALYERLMVSRLRPGAQ